MRRAALAFCAALGLFTVVLLLVFARRFPGRSKDGVPAENGVPAPTHVGAAAPAPPIQTAPRGGKAGQPPDSRPPAGGDSARQPAAAGVVFELQRSGGGPCAGASITLLKGRFTTTAAADAQGIVSFEGIPAGTYTFTVAAPGAPELASARELELATGEARRVSLVIQDFSLSISGRVLARNGEPVPDVTIHARRQFFQAASDDLLRADQEQLVARSGADGRYELSGVDSGEYALTTEATEVYPPVRRVFRGGAQAADIVLDTGRKLEVHGVVTERGGGPLARARVQPVGQPTGIAESDEQGRYSIEVDASAAQSVFVITASREGYRESRVNIRSEEVGAATSWELDFVLEPLGVQVAVEGFLGDLDRNPVPGETVFLQSASIGSRYQATSDARGKFQFARVQVGDDYRLWTYPRQGLRDYVKTAVSVPASGLEIEILLEPLTLGTLRGAVVDAAGAPVPAFTLWLRSMKALGSSLSLLSDGQGRFEVDSVPEGELIFETRSEPRITVRGLRFMLEPVEDLRLVVDWGRLAAEGSVVDESGSPIPGASVTVTWSAADGPAQSSSFRSGVTDAAGRFTFGDLGPGEHKILATAPGHMPAQGKVDPAAPGDPAVLRLRTKPQRPAEAESPRRP
jgi:hypothetical protein